MAASMNYVVLFCIFTAASWIRYVTSSSSLSSSSASTSTCRVQRNTFIHDLQIQCPHTISSSSPIEMNGESLDEALSPSRINVYTSVLFYASSCPFSSGIQTKFAALSTIFPQIKHIMVEQSSAMPRVLSRYGIHSLPSILMVNRTQRARYHGPKDLCSLVHFYKRTTGLDPVVNLTDDQGIDYEKGGHKVPHPWKRNSAKEEILREPYLVSSVLFLFIRVFLYFYAKMISCLIALWVALKPHLNAEVLGESSQRVLHIIDLKRVWSKLKLCKTRNFHNGAMSAQVWVSSLASVSLGETSSARLIASGDS
ncbi:5-adenylylsulfate reductase-like [Sarracenia purpurea var. burkii]